MADRTYIEGLNLSSEEGKPFKDLLNNPFNFLKKEDDGKLLTVADNEETAAFVIAGLPLCRKAYSKEEMQHFTEQAKNYIFIHYYVYDYNCYYNDDLSRYKKEKKEIDILPSEYVIKNGELFGFYFLMDKNGRTISPKNHIEGVFLTNGDYYGFTCCSHYDTDSFSDPSYYEEEEKFSVSLGHRNDENSETAYTALNGERIPLPLPPKEKEYIPLEKYRSGINNMCLVSRMITDEGNDIGAFVCLDKKLISSPDSGWIFINSKEPKGYLSKEENYLRCSLQDFTAIHPEVIPFLERDFYVCDQPHYRAVYVFESGEWTAKRKL